MLRSQNFFYFSKSKSKSIFRNKCIENKKKFNIVNRNPKRQFHTMNNGPNGPDDPDYFMIFLGGVSAYYTMKLLYK